uniref:myosin-1-like n=1 Tax=Fragaria vesca subsp. vesca TaxID=101020 RepID=UPI0005C9CCDA|nr:PREDICTED: myosin-1-like [Fragaria vesca subsp. vesca]
MASPPSSPSSLTTTTLSLTTTGTTLKIKIPIPNPTLISTYCTPPVVGGVRRRLLQSPPPTTVSASPTPRNLESLQPYSSLIAWPKSSTANPHSPPPPSPSLRFQDHLHRVNPPPTAAGSDPIDAFQKVPGTLGADEVIQVISYTWNLRVRVIQYDTLHANGHVAAMKVLVPLYREAPLAF